MTNVQRLATEGSRNHKIFLTALIEFKDSQGFYGQLYNAVNELNEDDYNALFAVLEKQQFTNTLDVVFWLEC